MSHPTQEKATAGLRGAHWSPSRMPSEVQLTAHPLPTEDGAVVSGFWFKRGNEDTVVVIAHPREHLVSHYLVPEVLRGGAAVWCQAPRLVGNDVRLEHEIALYDLAAAMRFLRGQGYANIIVLGNSGGAPLWALYNQQAMMEPQARLRQTPAGRPTRLDTADLPPPDGVIFVSAHKGQGALLMDCLDPAVANESDPTSTVADLDPFSEANGFRPAPETASYTSEFAERYRHAQRQRVERIDAHARSILQVKNAARAALKQGDRNASVLAAYTPIFTVWRTDADLRSFDLSLDPSERRYGSLWGANPHVTNYGSVAFGRVCTAESWLSTWSALSTNASMEKCAPSISQPTLMIEYTGDNSVFPSDANQIFNWIGAADKTRRKVAGDHHGRSVKDGTPSPQQETGELIRAWLAEKFGCKKE
jgi:hypothetical protein